jgi:hypothetical protein
LSVGAKTGTSGPNRGSEKAGPVGYGFLIWAIAGIVILALALLFLLLIYFLLPIVWTVS